MLRQSLIERLLEHGECEALLQLAVPGGGLKIRSLAWTGDEVGYLLRPEGYVEHLRSLLAAWPAQVVIVGFGMNESFAGAAGLEEFRSQYLTYLSELARLHPGAQLIVLSPIAVDDGVDAVTRNRDLAAYSAVIGELAAATGATWIDLFRITAAMRPTGGERSTRNQQSADQQVSLALKPGLNAIIQYIPASPEVLGAIGLLAPGASGTLTLATPLAPGRYPYRYTFPGHWRIMRGVLIVE